MTVGDRTLRAGVGAVLGDAIEFKRDRLGLFLRTYTEQGDIGTYRLGRQRFHLVNSADLVQEILVEQGASFEKTDRFRAFARPLLGDGLLTAMNAEHLGHRRAIQPKFNKAVLRNSVRTIGSVADAAVARWTDGVHDVRRDMVRLVLEIVGWNLFSRDVCAEADELGNALTDAIHGFDAQASATIPLTIGWPTPANLRYRRAVRRLERSFHSYLAERRASPEQPDDWLNLLLEWQRQSGGAVGDRQVRDEALNLFMPGHETTATALTWSLYLLAGHPEVYARMTDEVDRVLGDRLPTADDLFELSYTRRVFEETLRLYPPVYMFTRQASRDVTIRGLPFPAGSVFMFSPYALHRRPDYFPDPETFDPDRFAPDRVASLPRHAYLPFGAGVRVCIGNNHALLTGQIVLAVLARRIRLDRIAGHEPAVEPMVTLRPRAGMPLAVSRRTPVPVAG